MALCATNRVQSSETVKRASLERAMLPELRKMQYFDKIKQMFMRQVGYNVEQFLESTDHIEDLLFEFAGPIDGEKIKQIFVSQVPKMRRRIDLKKLIPIVLCDQPDLGQPFKAFCIKDLEKAFGKFIITAGEDCFIDYQSINKQFSKILEAAQHMLEIECTATDSPIQFTPETVMSRYDYFINFIGINIILHKISRLSGRIQFPQLVQPIGISQCGVQPIKSHPILRAFQRMHKKSKIKKDIILCEGEKYASSTSECYPAESGPTTQYVLMPKSAPNKGYLLHELGHIKNESSIHQKYLFDVTALYYLYEIINSSLSANTKLSLFLLIQASELAWGKIDEYGADSFMLKKGTKTELLQAQRSLKKGQSELHELIKKGDPAHNLDTDALLALEYAVTGIADVHPTHHSRIKRIKARIRELEQQEREQAAIQQALARYQQKARL